MSILCDIFGHKLVTNLYVNNARAGGYCSRWGCDYTWGETISSSMNAHGMEVVEWDMVHFRTYKNGGKGPCKCQACKALRQERQRRSERKTKRP
jgi:hypothetical protein